MIFGVQYYPEHWEEDRWSVDAQMMREAGVNTLRMGEFAWSSYEPVEGIVDFSAMERAIDLFGEHGISTILCTCSRTPPLWLYRKHPEIRAVEANGICKPSDHRYHVGLSHPAFARHAERIDCALIDAFANNKNVIAWQIDNEVGSNNDCFCSDCLVRFRQYLREKYQSPEVLNKAWGANFWSFRVNDFDDVPMPTTYPQALLEYRRFMSSVNEGFARSRAAMMRRAAPEKPVTTNFQNLYLAHSDYPRISKHLDYNGMNNYAARTPELALDYYRSDRRTFWVLEQQTHLNKVDSPEGHMRLRAWLAIAHGANAMLFFRWRQCRWGREQYGDGILPHSGEKNRLYRELNQMGAEVSRIGQRLCQTHPKSEVAIAYDYPSRWAVGVAEYEQFIDPVDEAIEFHNGISPLVTSIDALDPKRSLVPYKLVIAPHLMLVDSEVTANLEAYVAQGGVLCLTAGSGIVDRFGKSFAEPRPGPLNKLAGIRVMDLACQAESYCTLESDRILGLRELEASKIFDEIVVEEASVLATYASGWRKGKPAFTENSYGKGKVYYLGTNLDKYGYAVLSDWLCARAGLQRRVPTASGVSIHERKGTDETFMFLFNWNDQSVAVDPGRGWSDAFSGRPVNEVSIPPVDLRVLSK